MDQVTITYNGKSQTVARSVVESQLRKAEDRIAADRAKVQSAEVAADISRFESIAAACRTALA